jgi:hypothetical protein
LPRVYRFHDLKAAGVPFTRKHVTHLEKHGWFPKHFNITDFSVGWVGAEVNAWVESKGPLTVRNGHKTDLEGATLLAVSRNTRHHGSK